MMIILFVCAVFAVHGGPKIAVEGAAALPLGSFPAKDAIEGGFKISNAGDEELRIIALHKTCGGCIELNAEPAVLAAGEKGTISLKTVPGTLYGPFSKNFFVETNDPGMRLAMFTFSGDARPIALLKPSGTAYLGRMEPGSRVERSFLVEPLEKGVVFGKPVCEGAGAGNLELSSEAVEGGLALKLVVGTAAAGGLNCRVLIPVEKPEGWPPLEIAVAGSVGETEAVEVRKEDRGAKKDSVAVVEYYHQAGCRECQLIDELVMPEIARRFGGRVGVERFDIFEKKNFVRLMRTRERLGSTGRNESVCMVVNGRHLLEGYKDVSESLAGRVGRSLEAGEILAEAGASPAETDEDFIRRRGSSFTLWMVVLGGLADGVNPCVFSALVFFMSVFAVSGVRGWRLALFGAAYCLACFVTYFLLGFGVFRFIQTLDGFSFAGRLLNAMMAAVLIVFSVLSFRDAWLFRRSGKADSVSLKLPEALSGRLRSLMSGGAKSQHLLAGAVFTGFSATIIESACTGQIYLPTLVLLAKMEPLSFRWISYLLLYNLMFIVPLLAIFAAVMCGATRGVLLDWSRKNVVWGKALMGLFFLLLAAAILVSGLNLR